jgi:hypothetical protein
LYNRTVFDDVLAHLIACGVDFVVTGGHAVQVHGYERPVEDLDIVVNREPVPATRAMQCLMAFGFFPSVPLHISDVVVLTFNDSGGRRVDVNARYLIPFEELSQRAVPHVVLEKTIRVIALDDLIHVKEWRGRPYDVDDITRLREIHGLTAE